MKANYFMKGISLALAAGIVAAGMTGCGKKEETGTADGAAVINVWTGDTGSKLIFEDAISEYNEGEGKKAGIKIVYEAKENLSQSMTVALQTKQAPEIFMAGDVAEYSEQGYIAAIDDLPGGAELIDSKKDYLLENKQMYKGKTYSIPFGTNTYGLIYNKDMFKEAGIVDKNGEAKPPQTIAEMVEDAKKLTDAKSGKYGFIIPLKWGGMFGTDFGNAAAASSARSGYDPTTGKYDYSGFAEALNAVMQMKADKSIMPGAEGLDNDPARSRFAEGKIGMKYGVSWDVGVLTKQFPAKCDWSVAPLPKGSDGKDYWQGLNVNTGYKISKDGVDKVGADKIMTAYKYLVGEELQKKIYEKGANLPLEASIVDSVKSDNLPKGWKEFAELIKISKPAPIAAKVDISGETDFGVDFVNNVWTGKKSVEDAINDANRIYNAGVEKYYSLHTDADINDVITADYTRER